MVTSSSIAPTFAAPASASVVPTATVGTIPIPAVPIDATGPLSNVGTCASQASGPASALRRPSDTARNARATSGSNWVPEFAASSARACSAGSDSLYDRGGGHHVIGGRHRDDASGPRDLLTAEALRIAATVGALVVIERRHRPLAQAMGSGLPVVDLPRRDDHG